MQGNWGGFLTELKQDNGWRVVLASAVGFGLGVTVLPFYTLGTFVVPLEHVFGWSRAQLQASLAFLVLATLLGAWVTGWLIDRYGVRRVALGGQICLATSLALLALTPGSLWYWYTVWFFMSLTALGTSPIAWTRAVAGWFDAGRGFALALALCGSGVAAIIVPSSTAWLIEIWGWRAAYFVLAGLVLVVAIPTTIYVMPRASQRPRVAVGAVATIRPAEAGLEVPEALKNYRFWVLLLSTVLLGFAMSGTIPNLVPMLIDRGLAPATAASLLGVLGVSLIVGRLVTGVALDRIWAPAVAAMVLPMAALSCALFVYGSSDYVVLAAAVALFGLATGAEFDLIPYIVTRYFGLRRYSQIYALQWIGWTVFGGLAPAVFGYTFDVTGSYRAVLYAAALCFLVSPVLFLTFGPYPARQRSHAASTRVDDVQSQIV